MNVHLRPRAARSLLLVGALAAACRACDVDTQPPVIGVPVSRVQTIEVIAAPNANDTMAIAVDVVFVQQGKVADALTAAGATTWFETRDTLLARYAGQLSCIHLELVPGAVWSDRAPEDTVGETVAVLVFANYVTGEPKLVDVSTMEHARVYLCEQALALEPCR